MSRFNQVALSEDQSTVAVGAGCFWDDAYNALNGTGRGVVGARAPGVGVGGFLLGGGCAYHTSQYGLAMDNIAAYEIVFANATVATITSADEDVWFALRGAGSANFGIVSSNQVDSCGWGACLLLDIDYYIPSDHAPARRCLGLSFLR